MNGITKGKADAKTAVWSASLLYRVRPFTVRAAL
jgi:hypothetical protein